MKFKILMNKAEHDVTASADGLVVIDGKSYKTKVTGAGREKRIVQVGDKTYEVRFAKCEEEQECSLGEYVLELAGERVPVAVKDVVNEAPQVVAAPPAAAAQAGPVAKVAEEYTEGVFAPVPGKIVDVKVKAGDRVNEGDLIVILEAMKMENELHSPKQATIAAVLVNKGDQTTKGQLLVAFE